MEHRHVWLVVGDTSFMTIWLVGAAWAVEPRCANRAASINCILRLMRWLAGKSVMEVRQARSFALGCRPETIDVAPIVIQPSRRQLHGDR